ncbi:MAG: type ISP restriction/modification enzyme [Desulfococcaceae bacterium]
MKIQKKSENMAQAAIAEYIKNLSEEYAKGNTTEHSFRHILMATLNGIYQANDRKIAITNEPKKQTFGAPDYILKNHLGLTIGCIEAKDLIIDLDDFELHGKNKDQFKRYSEAEPNFILTNNLEFRFYREGKRINTITAGRLEKNKKSGKNEIVPDLSQFKDLYEQFIDFADFKGITLKSPDDLARKMAKKARRIADVFSQVLSDEAESTLKEQYQAFKNVLVHDMTLEQFADIYAQTVTYGLFSARLHDPTISNFSRFEAQNLIPKTNPFLRQIYSYVAGVDMDERIEWVVDDLCEIFCATDVRSLLQNFGKESGRDDLFIHFYETFLAEYDPSLRKARGVWFTPKQVVSFIVRAVDDLLISHFGLSEGLADAGKTEINGKKLHRVQVLDVAAGTGTFLAEVIRQIHTRFADQAGLWSEYVESDLIPRLHGFELLMASYTVCHTKLAMMLEQNGYFPTGKNAPRLSVYLTNSLEEYHPDTNTLFAQFLGKEANAANTVKRDSPIMVAMGNPPYSGESANKGEWITALMEDYKKEPGGKEKLKERNSKWINDDYVKFIRMGQYYIEKNGTGILAYITNHGYLDNPTFRGMRWNLLKTFDEIYIVDLHGNSKKKEVCPDGSKDENVFDIQQGVSINVFVKTGKKKSDKMGRVFHFNLYGKREMKYDFLLNNPIQQIDFKELKNIAPNYFFVQKDFDVKQEYDTGFPVSTLFPVNGVGITTAHDEFVIDYDKNLLIQRYNDFKNAEPDIDKLHNIFNVKKKAGWNILDGWQNLQNETDLTQFIKPLAYRPFDNRYIFYEKKLVWRIVGKVMLHFLKGENVGLNWIRPMSSNYEFSIFISKHITDQCSAGNKSAGSGISYLAPLYVYPEKDALQSKDAEQKKTPNLNMEIVQQIADKLNLTFTPEKEETENTFAPIDILDYIYGVLHSPSYREKYKEFLKIDFPRVPYPENADIFSIYVKAGSDLRSLHLMESNKLKKLITKYPVHGDNIITQIKNRPMPNGKLRVYINDTQYFDEVPPEAWEFYIGGYQPAQKWLKDRKGRKLSAQENMHWQKIIVALYETQRLMQTLR